MSRKSKETHAFERTVADYAPIEDIFSEDDHIVYRCKKALSTLSPADQRLFILYAELGTIREMARLLKMSPSTLHYRIARIRKRIIEKINNP